jgi:ethanolamine utilization protein EutM
MAKTKVKKKAICAKCGVAVRENTSFCYNCGSPVVKVQGKPATAVNGATVETSAETKAALDDLAKKFAIDEEADEKLAKAAAERK